MFEGGNDLVEAVLVAGGCSLDRDTVALLEAGGLHVDHVETYYLKGDPKLLGWTTQGRATRR